MDEDIGLYYYGARYYNPRLSIWYGVDPLAVYNPIMEKQFYGDGQHNKGVYYWGNLNPYIYTYQNPIRYIDPNGKQTSVTEVTLVNITVGFEQKHNRYFYKTTSTETVSRTKGINWIGSTEYNYTIFPKGGESPVSISSQDLKKGHKDELPGFIQKFFNPYNLDAYQNTKDFADSMGSGSSTSGRVASLLGVLQENKGVKRLAAFGNILQLSSTSLNIINELSIGEQKEALNIFSNDAFDAMCGEIITQSKIGKLYDAIGKPFYDQFKEEMQRQTEIKKVKR